jgi:intracellular multiplication protein IcmO
MGAWVETKEHARRALLSLTNSRQQTATAVAALSLPALLSPVVAVACAAAAGALLVSRHRATLQPFRAVAGKGAPRQEGAYPIGTLEDGTPVRLTAQQARSGIVVHGDTGSGKTEAMLGIVEGMLAKGSGLIWVDGIGDVSIYAKVAQMAAAFGREDDVLFVMPAGDDGTPRAHCFNPFETGTSQQLTILVGDLLEDSNDGAAWRGRSIAMVAPVLEALVWRRDAGIASLDIDVILSALILKNVATLAEDPDLPEAIREKLRNYLRSLPGYQPERGEKQAQAVIDQHVFLETQVSPVLRQLARSGLTTSSARYVDLADVLLNDRILVVMLPSVRRDEHEASMFGRAAVAMLKMAVAALPPPTRTFRPFPIVLDELRHYASAAAETIAAQASSLGIAMIYGAGDEHPRVRPGGQVAERLVGGADVKLRMSHDGSGRMKAAIGSEHRDIVAIYPRAQGREAHRRIEAHGGLQLPADLIPLTAHAAE